MQQGRSRARKLTVAGAVAVALVAGLILGGLAYGRSIVRQRLERVATAAGLQLRLGDIALSPTGTLTLEGLHLARADGSDVVAAGKVRASISPIAALRGSRRPERIAVRDLRVDIRVVDGKPTELFDLYRATRGASGARREAEARRKVGRGTALRVDGGELRLSLRGKGAELLPAGLAVQGLQMDFDPRAGRGDVRATVQGSVSSRLSATLHPASADRPARVEATMSPRLRIDLPARSPLARWIGAVVVRGFGYDAVSGPSINGVELLASARAMLRPPAAKKNAPAARGRDRRVAPSSPRDKARAKSHVRPSQPHILRRPRRKRRRGRPGRRHRGRRGRRHRTRTHRTHGPRRPGGARIPLAPRAAPPSVSTPLRLLSVDRITTDEHGLLGIRADGIRFALPAALAARLPLAGWQPSGTARAAWLSTDSPEASGTFEAAIVGLKIPLPSELGEARLGAVTLTLEKPAAGLRSSVRKLELQDPVLDMVYRESSWKESPLGARLAGLITAARRGRVARRLHEADTDEADEPPPGATGAPPRPRRHRHRRRSSTRAPFTASLIGPLRRLHRKLIAVPDRLDGLISAIETFPGLSAKMTGGVISLRDPVAERPFGGLREIGLRLTPTLADGSRGLGVEAHAFAGADPLGELHLDLTAAPGGRLDRLKVAASGGGLAKAVALIGASAAVLPDARLGVSATVTRQGRADLKVAGELTTRHVGLDWWRLAPRPIDDFDLSARWELVATATEPSIRLSTTELKSGDARASLLLEVTLPGPGKASAHLVFGLPRQDCGAIAGAIPASMMPTIGEIRAAGDLEMSFDLLIPLHNPYKGRLKVGLDDEGCVVESFGHIDVAELAGPFKRPVNENGTILEDQLIGPASGSWVDLAELPPWVPHAMLATEDEAFYHHHGVRPGLTSRAIKMCLDRGRFVYGGSTITQQLVKNLYLTRAKNLARKFEELLIVWQLERNLLADVPDARIKLPAGLRDREFGPAKARLIATKDRILEVYLNSIEFAPSQYGITRAARIYFDKAPGELSPLEAAFLASNKFNPKWGHSVFEKKKWTPWWQSKVVSVLSEMREDGVITDEEFAAEAPYVPRFVGWPGADRKAPGSEIGGVPE